MPRNPRIPALAALFLLAGCDASLPDDASSTPRTQGGALAHPTGLDLVARNVTASCNGTAMSLSAEVWNAGQTGISASTTGIYAGNPAEGGVLLGTVEVPWLYGREPFPFQRDFTVPEGTTQVFVVADDIQFFPEDDEVNNFASFTFDTPCITPVPPNGEPVALCQDVTVPADDTCQASASVDRGSFDPDSGPGALSVSQIPEGPYALGATPVQLTVSDGEATQSCAATVTVVDTTAPVAGASKDLVLRASASSGYATVSLSDCALPATDNCGGTLDLGQSGTLLRVTSDETDDALSILRLVACDDIQVSADGKSARVRAEAALLGNGRVYTFTYAVNDEAGNTTTGTCKVSVPAVLGGFAVDSGPAYCEGTGCPANTGSGGLCSLL